MQSQGRLSMVTYLERQGGYAHQRNMRIQMLMLANIADAFFRGDDHAAREHLALALGATEQAASDNGRWDLAFLLTLLEEPAPTLFGPRPAAANTRLRAFSPLVPQSLASVTLAYVKEVDLLSQRRKDAVQPGRNQAQGHRGRGGGPKAPSPAPLPAEAKGQMNFRAGPPVAGRSACAGVSWGPAGGKPRCRDS